MVCSQQYFKSYSLHFAPRKHVMISIYAGSNTRLHYFKHPHSVYPLFLYWFLFIAFLLFYIFLVNFSPLIYNPVRGPIRAITACHGIYVKQGKTCHLSPAASLSVPSSQELSANIPFHTELNSSFPITYFSCIKSDLQTRC